MLDRIRRRLRPRNRQTRKSLCQPRIEEACWIFARMVWPLRQRGRGLSQAMPAQPIHAVSTDRATDTASPRLARDLRAGLRPVQPSPAIRQDRDGGITSRGDQFQSGFHPTKTAAWRSRNERQSSGKLHHPLWQRSENLALTVGVRAAPFGDLGERSTTTGAMACARIERADIDARRSEGVGHCIAYSATS